MENKKSSSLHHLFSPSCFSSSSSPTSEIFRSIVRPPDLDRERNDDLGTSPVCKAMKHGSNPDNYSRSSGINGRKEKSFMQGDKSGEPHYFSSSIYYGGRENYSPRTRPTETYHTVNKSENEEDGGDDGGGSHLNGASRGNWWKGSFYY